MKIKRLEAQQFYDDPEPPLGLVPIAIAEMTFVIDRIREIDMATARYIAVGLLPPKEWDQERSDRIEEYQELSHGGFSDWIK